MNFTVKRQNRKTAAIHILPDGTVEVRAPKNVSQDVLQEFVNKHEKWILKRQAELLNRGENKNLFAESGPETFRFLGKEFPIEHNNENRIGFDGKTLCIPKGFSFSVLKPYIIDIYKKQGLAILKNRTSYFADIMKVKPAEVKISSAARRWGSCSSAGNINFTWRLIMAPLEAIDSVIVHELAHLKEMNHSADFYKIVTDTMPDYFEREKLLKDLQAKLNNEEW